MSKFKSILISTIVLFAICLVVSTALVYTNAVTEPVIIEAQTGPKFFEKMKKVITADTFNKREIDGNTFYEAINSGQVVGFVFTTSAKGYGDKIVVMTGIKVDGKIASVNVISADKETPGLGQLITKPDFLNQFKEKQGNLKVKENIDAVTGATISSRAVTNSVNSAYELFLKFIGGKR